jgi:hypothetical protein
MIRAVCYVVYAPGKYGTPDRELAVFRHNNSDGAYTLASGIVGGYVIREKRILPI